MKIAHTRKLVYTGLCIAIGLILPQFINVIPVSNPGAIFLPMHIPVLLSGFLSGPVYGVMSGIILPLLASALTGRPVIFPTGISMIFELSTYGMLSGLLYKISKGKIYPALIGAMIGGRIVMGIANTILLSFTDKAYGMEVFIVASFITALPGIVVQIVLIPSIVYALRKVSLAY